MKANIGSLDKVIRIILAIAFAMLYITKMAEGTLGIILLVVGAVLLLTSIINFCPLYAILGWSSGKKK
jgi:hypothetical protein